MHVCILEVVKCAGAIAGVRVVVAAVTAGVLDGVYVFDPGRRGARVVVLKREYNHYTLLEIDELALVAEAAAATGKPRRSFLDWLKTQSEDHMIDDSWL